MTSPVDISVIIPTYNRDVLLLQAIDSCLASQSQALRLQVIVVDDCSTIDTRSVLARYAGEIESLYLTENHRQCRARNSGMGRARGKWIRFLDSDDTLEPGSLAREVALGEATGADMVVSGWGTVDIDNQGNRIARTERVFPAPDMIPIIDAVLHGKAVPTGAALYRRSSLGSIRWDPEIQKLDDWDFFCQAALQSRSIARFDATAYWWRSHHGERVSRTSMIINARDVYRILGKIETFLIDTNQMTEPRARRLAQYYYKELRVLCVHDRPAFYRVLDKIHALDPDFVPAGEERQAFMRVLARLIGTKNAVLLHTKIKTTLAMGKKSP